MLSKQWSKSTFVFTESIELNSIIIKSSVEYYSRYLVKSRSNNSVYILSGEDQDNQVYFHLLTRSIKIGDPEQFKKIERLVSRCELYRSGATGYFTFGLWGKQDLNRDKVNIPFIAINDNTSDSFPNNIRQNIPIGRMMGKCKTFTILQGGYLLPKSSIDGFEFETIGVENNILR